MRKPRSKALGAIRGSDLENSSIMTSHVSAYFNFLIKNEKKKKRKHLQIN